MEANQIEISSQLQPPSSSAWNWAAACLWQKQAAPWISKADNPEFCQFIADVESGFCQKHGMIVAELGSEYKS
jgi:hypothetical protein